MIYTFDITPQPKPRMTQRDKWEKYRTQAAANYIQYKNDLQILQMQNRFLPSDNMTMTFWMPINKSKIPNIAFGSPHQIRPDIDNLVKGFLDAFFDDDCVVWHVDAFKFWTNQTRGKITIDTMQIPS